MRRFLLERVTPELLAPRVPSLWRNDHSHGDLTARVEGRGILGRLRNHPFTQTTVSRLYVAELCRHVVSRTRVKNVSETHRLDSDGSLVIHLSWS